MVWKIKGLPIAGKVFRIFAKGFRIPEKGGRTGLP